MRVQFTVITIENFHILSVGLKEKRKKEKGKNVGLHSLEITKQ
jgi:hypothetical protein